MFEGPPAFTCDFISMTLLSYRIMYSMVGKFVTLMVIIQSGIKRRRKMVSREEGE